METVVPQNSPFIETVGQTSGTVYRNGWIEVLAIYGNCSSSKFSVY
jgi:hypothetical protein